jgi:hypothetical protein
MHVPTEGSPTGEPQPMLPPATKDDVRADAIDPGQGSGLLEPFFGAADPPTASGAPTTAAGQANDGVDYVLDLEDEPLDILDLDEQAVDVLELEDQLIEVLDESDTGHDAALAADDDMMDVLEFVDDDVTEPAASATATEPAEPELDPADAPWDALGRAIDDALSRAAAAASLPLADWAAGDSAEDEPVAGLADEPEHHEVLELAAEDIERAPETPSEPDAARRVNDAAPFGAPGVEQMADRLEALATRLRVEGPEALTDALGSDDRLEALLAAFLSGVRLAEASRDPMS